jgi:hypothetical protein
MDGAQKQTTVHANFAEGGGNRKREGSMQFDEDFEEESGEEDEEESDEESEEESETDSEEDSENDNNDNTNGPEDREAGQQSEVEQRTKDIVREGKTNTEDREKSDMADETRRAQHHERSLAELTVGAEVVVDGSVHTVTNIGYGRYSGQVRIEGRRNGFGFWILSGEVDQIIRSGDDK